MTRTRGGRSPRADVQVTGVLSAYRFDVPRARLWQTLLDTAVVGSCIPGVSAFTPLGDDRYEIELAVRVGIVSDKGTLAIATREPESYRMTVAGAGPGDQGHGVAGARMRGMPQS